MPALLVACFTLGLAAGSHCLLMCGGIVGLFSTQIAPARRRPLLIGLHLGRLLTYVALGMAVAAWGSLSVAVAPLLRLVLRALAALLVAGAGLRLLGIAADPGVRFPLLRRYARAVSARLAALLPLQRLDRALLAGMVWGALPCGLSFSAALLAASTESLWLAAGGMLAFGLGSLPWLLSVDALLTLARRLPGTIWARRAAGVLLLSGAMVGAWLSVQAALAPAACHSSVLASIL